MPALLLQGIGARSPNSDPAAAVVAVARFDSYVAFGLYAAHTRAVQDQQRLAAPIMYCITDKVVTRSRKGLE